jgi:hypothetical protein
MPARTLQGVTAQSRPDEVAAGLVRLAGGYDDPIAQVRSSFGPANDQGFRVLTMEVVDRQGKVYPPTAFRNAKGWSPGRWLILYYIHESAEHSQTGSPTPIGVDRVPGFGLPLGSMANSLLLVTTNLKGIAKVEIQKAGTDNVWVHAAVIGLLRTAGINWTTGAPAPEGTGGDEAP